MNKNSNKKNKGKKFLKNVFTWVVIPILFSIFLDFYMGLSYLGALIFTKLIKIKRRGYFAKDKYGNELSFKEFMKRWRLGIEGITPLQQAWTSLMGSWIIVTGILSGIIINCLVRMKNQWWWIVIILTGSLILVVIQMISGFQKYWKFKEVEKAQKELEESLI